MKKTSQLIFILSTAMVQVLLTSGCGARGNSPNIEVIQDMMEQPALKAQDFQPYDREKSSMRIPPEGSWPKNVEPYMFKGKPVEAGEQLKNPYANDSTPEFLELGKRNFNNYCLLCHGPGAAGDGQIAAKFVGVKPPSLLTDKIKNYPDGRIFHIITDGQGIMGSYIHQMPNSKDRWAVVNYVRSLQKK
jgi:mono/diheme cytochrome c family protein